MSRPVDTSARQPQFVIVGTPRSGTTLVQRIASELPGVRVTPETHFFSMFYAAHSRGIRFPLGERELLRLLNQYLSMPSVLGLPVDVDKLVTDMHGTCHDSWALFSAIVRQLACEAEIVGEKTPNHLRWWMPFNNAAPWLKFIFVVRDPRGVVASAINAPFITTSIPALAAGWREDIRELENAQRHIDPTRLLILRYEEIISSPDAWRRKIGTFLGVIGKAESIGSTCQAQLFLPWESSWKSRARGLVDSSRANAWQNALTARERRRVEVIASSSMLRWGYLPTEKVRPSETIASLAHADSLQIVRCVGSRRRQRLWIRRSRLSGG